MPRVAMLAPLPAEAVTSRIPDAEVAMASSQAEAAAAARGADVCVADWRGEIVVDAQVVEALAPTCRLIQVPAAGVNGVDLDACAAAGLRVASCAGLNTEAVADWCVWATIDAMRRLTWSDRALRQGRWEMFGHPRFELAGKSVGIVGLGSIGTAAAHRFGPFGTRLRYWSRTRKPALEEQLGLAYSDLEELVAEVDALVLTVALTDQTRRLLDADRLARMKQTAVVVNAARGEIVDETALAAALTEGRLLGAATDVFSTEPPPDDHPLLACETAVLTPHIAGTSAEAVGRIIGRVYDNLEAALAGREPQGVLDL